MTPVVCATSMASAFNVVLNLVCIWLLLIVVADLRKVRDRQKKIGTRHLSFSGTGMD